jgi:tRNA N6-adenosine threonylcarbamoyltransferase
MNLDRVEIDFKNEIKSLYNHEKDFTRPRLGTLVNNIYIPKLKAKQFTKGVFGGETP